MRNLVRSYVKKVRKVRPVYLVAAAVVAGASIVFLEWDFVKHIAVAMTLETTFHHLLVAAVEAEA